MEELTKLVSNINSFIWGMYCLIPLLCGVGIYFTIRLKFIQPIEIKALALQKCDN